MESRPYDNIYDTTYVDTYNNYNSKGVSVSDDQIARSRFKYFRPPPESALNSKNFAITDEGDIDVDSDSVDISNNTDSLPNIRDAYVQTMYRESDCQTDPYSPEYIIKENTQPDILLVDNVFDLKQKDGIHVTNKEVKRILELRNKKHLYDNLPPFTDEMSVLLRQRLLEDQELREMKLHVMEIDENREIK